ncbi:MAG: hypothetical protein IT292_03805 [Deltaproteobacteria bacterium]|nr:hypothetical protein [Deltaproteobacteria bacterium]
MSGADRDLQKISCPPTTEAQTGLPDDWRKQVATVYLKESSLKSINGRVKFAAVVRVLTNKGFRLLVPASANALCLSVCQENGRGFCEELDPQEIAVYARSGEIARLIYDSRGRAYYRIAQNSFIDIRVSSDYVGLAPGVYRGYIKAINAVQAFLEQDRKVLYREVCDDGQLNGQSGKCNSQCTGLVPAVGSVFISFKKW